MGNRAATVKERQEVSSSIKSITYAADRSIPYRSFTVAALTASVQSSALR